MRTDIIDNRFSWLTQRPNESQFPEFVFGLILFALFVTTGFVKLWMIGLVGLFFLNASMRHIYFKPSSFLQTSSLWLFLLYLSATFYWSVDKSRTLDAIEIQLIVFFTTFLMAVFLVQRDWLNAVVYAFIGVILYNYFYILLNPNYAFTSIGLRGSFYHKNGFGSVLALAILVFYFAKTFPLRKYLLIISSLTLLVTQSKTSMLLLVIALLLTESISKFNLYALNYLRKLVIPVGVILVIAIFYHQELIRLFLGALSAESFTGRGLIWMSLLNHFQDSWFYGLGLGVLWTNKNFDLLTTTQFYWDNPEWADKLTGADSGYVDAILMIGFLGFIFFVSMYLFALYRLLPLLNQNVNCLIFAFLIYLGLHNLTESTLLLSANANWFVLVFSIFYANLVARQRHPWLKDKLS